MTEISSSPPALSSPSFGLVGSYSTFFSHHMATMEGGLIVTDDEEMYHVMVCLRAHGWTRHLPKENFISNKSDNNFEVSKQLTFGKESEKSKVET